LHPIRANQGIDEELEVLGRRCTHKELKDLKKKKKKRTDKQR